MTEAEWLACDDPTPMLEFLRGKVSDRKLRLFAAAGCRWLCTCLKDERSRTAIDIAEQFADGLCTETELQIAYKNADNAFLSSATINDPDKWTPADVAAAAVLDAANLAFDGQDGFAMSVCQMVNKARIGKGSDHQVQLVREIVGNPFLSISIHRVWLTTNVIGLAQAVYGDRAFDRLPILADALEDAGCDNRDILDHCRGPGPHVRGCWVVDLVLGKS